MATYSIRYNCLFDPMGDVQTTPVYSVNILQKDYTGNINLVTGAATPVIHQWQTDDPKAPIKGSSLSISLINTGQLPLSTFLTNDDTEFKVQLFKSGSLLFEGFLVQDDCTETLIDFAHEINLSATDNLGLLKGVTLDKSPAYYVPVYSISGDTYSSIAANTLVLSATLAPNVLIGDILKIHNLIFDATYTVVDNSASPNIIVKETVGTSPSPITADITVTRASLLDKVTLASIIGSCLLNTNLALDIKVWGHIHETTQDKSTCFLLQTLIDPQTFITGSTTTGTSGGININLLNYQDCYTVLTNILGRFKFTLFQSNGVWNLVRWDDLRFYGNLIPSYHFDSNFTYLGTENLPTALNIAANLPPAAPPDIYPSYGLLHRVFRGYEFDRETFNYKQPALILRNYDLTNLGGLKKKYQVTIWITKDGVIHYTDPGTGGGTGVVKTFQTWVEYVANYWYPSTLGLSVKGDYFIRIIEDSLGNEVDRYMCVLGDCRSYPIEANMNDVMKYSYSFRTQASQPGPLTVQVFIQLYNGTTTNYLTATGWGTGAGYAYTIDTGDNSNKWHTVTVDSTAFPFPFDGLLYVYLRVADLSGIITETQYKDIRLEYTPLVNGTTKIIGQYSQTTQTNAIKQNDNTEVYIDSSPRNSIAGTLFLNSMTGLLQTRAGKWQHTYYTESENLGQITTEDEMFWRRKSRSILEGSIYGLNGVSMLSVFKYDQFPTLNFVMGKSEIDYRNNRFTGTLWEMWEDGENECVVYSFGATTFPVGAWSISGTNCDGSTFNYSSISGTGAIPGPICCKKGSVTSTGAVTVTEGASCGDFVSNYIFNYLYNPI